MRARSLSRSHPTVRRGIAGVGIAIAVLVLQCRRLSAQQEGLDAIDPAGLPGTLLICGTGVTEQQLRDALRDLSPASLLKIEVRPGEDAELPIGPTGGTRAAAYRRFRDWEEFDSRDMPVIAGAVLWLDVHVDLSDGQPSVRRCIDWLRGAVPRVGVLVVSGPAAAPLCREAFFDGRINVQCDPGAILRIRQRQMTVVTERGGDVTLLLLPGRPGLPETVRIDRQHPADLTQWRRAAALRTMTSPPEAVIAATGPSKGSLVIVGGGRVPDDIWQKFLALAGGSGARIVVIPTAGEADEYSGHRDADRFRELGAQDVRVLHTRDRMTARQANFLEPLRSATGVWFPGGRQWRLVDAYEGTPVEALCREVLERGGVVGGTSAGATILGSYLVRGHPLGNEVMMAEGYERGFGFWAGTAIDQHFTQRQRAEDLEAVKRAHPQLLCVGIDEGTALLVASGAGEVLGDGTVTVLDQTSISDDRPPDRRVLHSGDRYDLARQAVTPGPRAPGSQPAATTAD